MTMPTEKLKKLPSAMNVREAVKLLSKGKSTLGVNECSWCEVLKAQQHRKKL